MATLELQFNCLCLFVPVPDQKVVHVLMPATNDHAGHAGHAKHVVRVLHKSFPEKENVLGRGMEGWALTLGTRDAKTNTFAAPDANTDLSPPAGAINSGVLPDLTSLTSAANTVAPGLRGDSPGNLVAARITLRSGKVTRIDSEATWEIKRTEFPLAHRVTWEMPGDDVMVEWRGLNNTTPATRPFDTLDTLEPEDDLGYKLRVFHVTEDALPPKGGTLKPSVMREHYRAFFPLIGINAPGDELLPRISEKHIDQVNCGAGQAGGHGSP